MGMFDSLYDADGEEWQTKAFYCGLAVYRIGETLPRDIFPESYPTTYQVEVLGDPEPRQFVHSFATVRRGVLTAVPADRDPALPLLNYSGHLIEQDS